MTTNITDLKFDDGATINVVASRETRTWVTTSFEMMEQGVLFEYHESGVGNFRVFVPWDSVDRIYEQLDSTP